MTVMPIDDTCTLSIGEPLVIPALVCEGCAVFRSTPLLIGLQRGLLFVHVVTIFAEDVPVVTTLDEGIAAVGLVSL